MRALELAGRLAVITGAGSGIGRGLAVEAAGRGMQLALADNDKDALEQTLGLVGEAGAAATGTVLDIRDADALGRFAENCFARSAPALVFANAGILKYESTLRPDLESWRRAVDINLMGTVNTVHAFLGRMIDANEPAQFVVTGSMGSFVAAPELASYGATKHAVWALAECLRMELGDNMSVGISLLAPPRVDTPLLNESEARTRAARGDGAAAALRNSAMTPTQIAQDALAGAVARNFYIAPQTDDVAGIIRQRIEELLAG